MVGLPIGANSSVAVAFTALGTGADGVRLDILDVELGLLGYSMSGCWPCRRFEIVTWLILPVVICLSQRLSHACLSVNNSYETANGSLNQLSNT